MSWTTNLIARLSPLLLPYLVLFCGGVFLTVCQSLGVLTPLPHAGGLLDAYVRILSDPSFFASFGFSLWVAAASAAVAVTAGTLLAYRVWQLPRRLAGAALIYKIPLILPHIAVAFVVLVFWSRSGILASVCHALGLIGSMQEFPNVLYSGWGLGMILAYSGSVYGFLAGGPEHAYFDSLTVFIALMLVGRWAQEHILERNRNSLLESSGAENLTARRVVHGEIEPLSAPEIVKGDELWIAPGDLAPVEGILMRRAAEVSLDWITGESDVVTVQPGAKAPAGAFNASQHGFCRPARMSSAGAATLKQSLTGAAR